MFARLDPQAKPFAIALTIFFVVWSVYPAMTAPNPPLDSVEQLAWGAGWQLGYYKHPPLVAWLYELTTHIGIGSWAFMWLSAASIAIAHLCVWRAARHVVDPLTALWSSALLQAIWLHNYFIPEFNQNVILIPLFAAAGWFAIRALKFGKPSDWIVLGAVIGIGLLSKYAMAVSAVVIALFFLIEPTARRRLATPGPYLGVATAALIFSPHAAWMLADHGGTIGYVVGRASTANAILDRLRNTAECVGEGILVLLVPSLFIWLGRDKSATPKEGPVAADVPLRRLVLTLAFAPIAIGALMALVAGFRIKTAWIAPFFEFTPLALLMVWRIDVSAKRWRWAGIATTAFAVLGLIVYCAPNLIGPQINKKPMRVHFPGPQLAKEVEQVWAQQAPGRPLRVIVGDTFVAGSAAYFAKDRPLVRIDDDPHKSPWAPDNLKRQAGAIIVWDIVKEGAEIPARFRAQNPTAKTIEIRTFPYLTRAFLPTARIGIAFIPPAP